MASLFNLAAVKNTLDEVRAQVYPRNETERKVYEALSSKNWGASTTMLNELANETYDYEKYKIITDIVWANLITDGKNWRQIFKTLTFIEFLIKNGAERFIEDCRDRLHKIRQLQDYNYYESDMDKGSGVREKSKQVVDLLNNNEAIRSEREKARALRNKFVGIDSRNASGPYGGYGNSGGGYSGSGGSGGGYSGSDSYSSGGRYDSYDSGSKYGGDSYSSNSNNNRRNSASEGTSGRYGGGAYDSNRPPRYDDDAPEPQFEEAKVVSKPAASTKTSSTSSTTATGGKLKVSIKKVSTPSANKAQEVDLMPTGDIDLMGGFESAPSSAPSSSIDFDPFATNAPVSNSTADFDPFGSSPAFTSAPAPSSASTFDPFVSAPTMASNQPAQTFGAFPPAAPMVYTPQQQPMGGFPNVAPMNNNMFAPSPPVAPYQPTPMMGFQPAPSYPSQQQTSQTFQTAPSVASGSQDVDFGDFEAAPQQKNNNSKPAADKWGDLTKLVDLNKIEKNETVSAKQTTSNAAAQSYANNSFAGLDGFSKTPQNMSATSNRPLGSMVAPMSSQPAMLNRPQTGMGAPMGGMNYGMAPMGGNPMGGMGGASMGSMMGSAPMGGNSMGMGTMGGPMNSGYGAAPNGMYGQNNAMYNGMGAPMGQPQMYPGGQGMGQVNNSYPQQNYGMPQYRNAF